MLTISVFSSAIIAKAFIPIHSNKPLMLFDRL